MTLLIRFRITFQPVLPHLMPILHFRHHFRLDQIALTIEYNLELAKLE